MPGDRPDRPLPHPETLRPDAPWDLKPLLQPRSVALVGCSGDLGRLSGRPLKYLLKNNYRGNIYPVNPKYDAIEGLACHPAMDALPEPVDVALLLVPAARVEAALQACVRSGARSAIIISS
ncbi:MAG: CoA-binding protein, partial [Desulfobacterales bacterium]|nr:CoA-binding protein [Desulfobacterales bacterium]